MNTGFLGPAVATVLTVYGIETNALAKKGQTGTLQQYLPFTVLKLNTISIIESCAKRGCNSTYRLRY